MLKKLMLPALLCNLFLTAGAQPQVKRSWAFAKPIAYGRELKDLDGNTITRADTAHFIFLETSTKTQPLISLVSYKGKSFTAAVHPVLETEVAVGTMAGSEEKIILKKKATGSLWLVELTPAGPVKPAEKIRVTGTLNKKAFKVWLKNFVMLGPDIVG